ncbi:MAG: ThuA domain-containing protein [Pirellulaceae bacterium]
MQIQNYQTSKKVVRFLRITLLGATLLTLCAVVQAASPQRQEGETNTASAEVKLKVLLIGHKPDHPPGTHLYLEECELLATCLRQTANVEAIVSDRWPSDPAVLENVSGIVVYSSPGAELLLQGEQREQFEKLMKKGVGLTALHWATGIGDKDNQALADLYLSYLGGLFGFAFSGLDISESRLEQVDATHPICRGWKDFDLYDEFYLDLKFLPEAKPILRVQVKGKPQTVGWVYERPDSNGGRSYGNTLGHFHELFEREPFRRMLVNGILWTLQLDIPPEGAPCAL